MTEKSGILNPLPPLPQNHGPLSREIIFGWIQIQKLKLKGGRLQLWALILDSKTFLICTFRKLLNTLQNWLFLFPYAMKTFQWNLSNISPRFNIIGKSSIFFYFLLLLWIQENYPSFYCKTCNAIRNFRTT